MRLFYTLGPQWRLHPVSGVRLAIDPTAIMAIAAMMHVMMTPARLDDLGTMERAALLVLNR